MRDENVAVQLVVFDVLAFDGDDTMRRPYRERRELLEALDFAGVCDVCPRFDDGVPLWQVVVDRQLEGVVAKRLGERYRPGERTWIKRKNPGCPRYEGEREAVVRSETRAAPAAASHV